MSGVAGQEQAAVAHGRGDEAAHRGNRFVGYLTFGDRPVAPVDLESPVELGPDPVVGPVLQRLARRDLQVKTGDRVRAHRVQGEAVFVTGVDQLVGGGGGIGEDAEPGERVGALVDGDIRDERPADPVKAVAPGDHVAGHLVRDARFVGVRQQRPILGDAGHGHVGGGELDRSPVREPPRDQVLDDLRLGVDRHRPPAGQLAEVEVVALPRELQVDPVVLDPLGVQPLADPGRAEQLDGAGLEHAGPLPGLAVRP